MLARTFHALPHPMRQIAGLACWLIAFFFFISFISYHQSDPSLNRSSTLPVRNWGGYAGALTADLGLQLIGLGCVLLVAVPFAWGTKMLMARPVTFLWLRFTLLLMGLTMASSLMAMIEPPASWPISSGFGGSIGALLHDRAPALYDNYAFIFALFFTTAAVLSIAFGMQWQEWRSLSQGTRQGVTMACATVANLRHFRRRHEEEDEYEDDEEYEEEEDAEEYMSLRERIVSRLMFWRREEEYDEDEEEGEEEEEYEDEEYEEEDEDDEETTAKRSRKSGPRVRKKAETSKAGKGRVKRQSSLALAYGDYELPATTLLNAVPKQRRAGTSEAALTQNARLLETVLQDFGVHGDIQEIRPGPVVTLYELEPAAGTKSSRVIGLSDDIARSMSAVSARIAVIPGRNAIGIELPNATRETVFLRELLESDSYCSTDVKLPLVLGKDIGGTPIVVDLAKMPHLLVAGTTGSGKSVAINTMILSLAFSLSPEACKFIMIDPKMLELSVYDGIPHLLTPVVTEPGKAVVALKWTVREMENRYRLMSNLSVRNIDGYNKKIREAKARGKELTRSVQTGFDPETGQPIIEEVALDMTELPYIVVIVDEMADLMLVAGKDIESSIQRLAQMARAAGIHIIMATQRPSVDVITGVIKANFPTRISFQVTSKIDSRTILGEQGAEQLLGQGDMLYMAAGGRITRVHGPFVSDREVEMVVEHLKEQGEPEYIEEVTQEEDGGDLLEGGEEERDELYDKAVAIVARDRKASTSYIQRCLKIGYNRAANIIERMEREGVIGPANHVGKREVLARNIDA